MGYLWKLTRLLSRKEGPKGSNDINDTLKWPGGWWHTTDTGAHQQSCSFFINPPPNTFWVTLLFQVLWLSTGNEGVRHCSQGQFPSRFVLIFSTVVSRWLPFPSCIPSARKWRTLCIFHGCRYFWGFHSLIHMTIGSAHRRLFRQSCGCTIVCSYTLVLPHDPSQVPSATLEWNLSLSCFPLMGASVPFVGKQYIN